MTDHIDFAQRRTAGQRHAGWACCRSHQLVQRASGLSLRISDARMSGSTTASITSRPSIGGRLALVKTSDLMPSMCPTRHSHLEVSDDELAQRRAIWTPPPKRFRRGYGWLTPAHPANRHRLRF
jgi:dihydroxy-acid dehydratase